MMISSPFWSYDACHRKTEAHIEAQATISALPSLHKSSSKLIHTDIYKHKSTSNCNRQTAIAEDCCYPMTPSNCTGHNLGFAVPSSDCKPQLQLPNYNRESLLLSHDPIKLYKHAYRLKTATYSNSMAGGKPSTISHMPQVRTTTFSP